MRFLLALLPLAVLAWYLVRAGLYGLGTYFTDNACKSCQYTNLKNSSGPARARGCLQPAGLTCQWRGLPGERVLVTARVLVGRTPPVPPLRACSAPAGVHAAYATGQDCRI